MADSFKHFQETPEPVQYTDPTIDPHVCASSIDDSVMEADPTAVDKLANPQLAGALVQLIVKSANELIDEVLHLQTRAANDDRLDVEAFSESHLIIYISDSSQPNVEVHEKSPVVIDLTGDSPPKADLIPFFDLKFHQKTSVEKSSEPDDENMKEPTILLSVDEFLQTLPTDYDRECVLKFLFELEDLMSESYNKFLRLTVKLNEYVTNLVGKLSGLSTTKTCTSPGLTVGAEPPAIKNLICDVVSLDKIAEMVKYKANMGKLLKWYREIVESHENLDPTDMLEFEQVTAEYIDNFRSLVDEECQAVRQLVAGAFENANIRPLSFVSKSYRFLLTTDEGSKAITLKY